MTLLRFQGHDIIQCQITQNGTSYIYNGGSTKNCIIMVYRTVPFSMTLNNP